MVIRGTRKKKNWNWKYKRKINRKTRRKNDDEFENDSRSILLENHFAQLEDSDMSTCESRKQIDIRKKELCENVTQNNDDFQKNNNYNNCIKNNNKYNGVINVALQADVENLVDNDKEDYSYGFNREYDEKAKLILEKLQKLRQLVAQIEIEDEALLSRVEISLRECKRKYMENSKICKGVRVTNVIEEAEAEQVRKKQAEKAELDLIDICERKLSENEVNIRLIDTLMGKVEREDKLQEAENDIVNGMPENEKEPVKRVTDNEKLKVLLLDKDDVEWKIDKYKLEKMKKKPCVEDVEKSKEDSKFKKPEKKAKKKFRMNVVTANQKNRFLNEEMIKRLNKETKKRCSDDEIEWKIDKDKTLARKSDKDS